MDSLKNFQKFTDTLAQRETTMPVLFTGHGSPMNGIEDNLFSATWEKLGHELDTPSAVICISAHWLTRGTHITAMEMPKTIHDFGGFPKELFEVEYPAPGNPALAKEAASLIHKTEVGLDHEWGLDHGTWSVIRRMYPKANIPVLQLSIDYTKSPQFHYELAREIESLRKKGVLIVGSGNMVHNLRIMDWNMPTNGYDWAQEMNEKFKTLINSNDHKSLINFEGLGQAAKLSIPTSEHYLPLLYVLGLKSEKDRISFFNDNLTMGSISMTSVMLS